jgi:hypothetical protein
MHRVVLREFRQWQELDPVIQLIIAEGTQVLLHCLILALRLAGCLGIECSQESVSYAHVRVDSSPEWAGELSAVVRDDVIR